LPPTKLVELTLFSITKVIKLHGLLQFSMRKFVLTSRYLRCWHLPDSITNKLFSQLSISRVGIFFYIYEV
jgi:hypothetical protein